MNDNDLATLLRSANVTINIHHGTGDINSSQEQHNHSKAAASGRKRMSQLLYTYRCESCGYMSHQRNDFIAHGGYGSWSYRCQECEAEKIYSRWIVELQSHDEPAQITAPEPPIIIDEPRRSYIDEIDARYTGDYEQLQRNAATLRDAELEMMRGWLNEIKTK